MTEDPQCPCCTSVTETALHATVLCPSSHDLWLRSGCQAALPLVSSNSFGEVILNWAEHLTPELYQRSLFLSWFIWFRCNRWIFENAWDPDEAILHRHSKLVVDFDEYTRKIYGSSASPTAPSSRKIWEPPPPGIIKVNVDARVSNDGWIGLGTVARDCTSSVLFSAVCRHKARWDPLTAESKAAWYGLHKAVEYGFNNIILEVGSLVLVNKLKKKSFTLAAVDNVLEDIVFASASLSSIVWSHVKQDGNFVAHHLARLVPYNHEQVWENSVPNEVSSYVLLDFLSMN
ncbi:uncharacterized protein LOC110726586 [Chenopodium quinoa]|uniref:uncharacterized protein LOC110726586 n=1 Tax=Chenopodium quinoa TaxID=63459 RepID=UPI000B794705|nr:uncharacterized protein LOC110726586 [Chenopodium quinoa]